MCTSHRSATDDATMDWALASPLLELLRSGACAMGIIPRGMDVRSVAAPGRPTLLLKRHFNKTPEWFRYIAEWGDRLRRNGVVTPRLLEGPYYPGVTEHPGIAFALWEWLESRTPDHLGAAQIGAMGKTLSIVHDAAPGSAVPCPAFPRLIDLSLERVESLADGSRRRRLRGQLERTYALAFQESLTSLHGDLTIDNVVWHDGMPMGVWDFDDASAGDRGWDFASSAAALWLGRSTSSRATEILRLLVSQAEPATRASSARFLRAACVHRALLAADNGTSCA